jgi:hypothetical protein
MTRPDATTITLYLSRTTALAAAERYLERSRAQGSTLYRIVQATMKDVDGTVDQGFKVQMVNHQRAESFYL